MWEGLVQKIRCWRGRHQAKFGTWPFCVWCGRLVKKELE